MTEEKPQLRALIRDDKATSGEGKYLVMRRDGTLPEWPSFVLGGRDPHAPAALRAYAASIATDPDCHPDLAARLLRLADEFDAYRAEHGPGDPTRGRHRKDDPDTVRVMRGEPRRVYLVFEYDRDTGRHFLSAHLREEDARQKVSGYFDRYVEACVTEQSATGVNQSM